MTTAHAKTSLVTPPAASVVPDPAIQNLESSIMNLKSQLARAVADYQNLEKRFEKDSASVVKFANANLLEKLLDLRDHLESASLHLSDKSLPMLLSLFDKILSEEGVVEVKTDGAFDPAVMECHETVPGEKDKIVSVARRGYMLSGRVLRPARVVVGSGEKVSPANEASEASV